MQIDSIITAISQRWHKKFHFEHAYIMAVLFFFCFCSSPHALYQQLSRETNHSLVHYCCVWQLLCISACWKGRQSRAKWNDRTLMWSHSQKNPHTSHVTWTISHQVTLYWGCQSLNDTPRHKAVTYEIYTRVTKCSNSHSVLKWIKG